MSLAIIEYKKVNLTVACLKEVSVSSSLTAKESRLKAMAVYVKVIPKKQ